MGEIKVGRPGVACGARNGVDRRVDGWGILLVTMGVGRREGLLVHSFQVFNLYSGCP